ncbi:S9 family peptidase [Acetobacter fallax]|uniref:Acyl-peptide hydrolase n=1 Tax=Acetobacter fallax TaxID=1737473 RepID=A0ABX0KDZ4_9PROT|nr:alpha/beta fold hydrolase [Acetobacter fallax]NHO34336.1 alpha/beta fold hydrolase [Acetobacter fallax]NHO37905.1 alpha/beta fold hydrolase [Acetobacter fallax]
MIGRHARLNTLLASCVGALAALFVASASSAAQQGDATFRTRLSELLAMPFASDLTGARNAPVIAWVERRNGIRNILISDDGNVPRRVTNYTQDDGTDVWGLALTPDGRTLAYVEGGDPEYPTDTPPNAGQLSFSGKQTVRLILPSGRQVLAGEGHSPVFSSDGTRLAFSNGGSLLIGRIGGKTAPVFTTPGAITGIRWSPDGSRLAVELDRGSHGLIALWDVAARSTRLTFIPPALASDRLPTFSPDSRFIAFVRTREPLSNAPPDKGRFWSLHVYDSAARAEHVLWTAPEGHGSRFAAPEGLSLQWTPSGQILFPWEGSGWRRICVLPAIGSTEPHCLTPDNAEVSSARLSQDGNSLLYTANVGDPDQWRAWSQSLSGNQPVRLMTDNDEVTKLIVAGPDIAVMATNATQTAHPVVMRAAQQKMPVTPILPQGMIFTMPQSVHFRSDDGLDLHGQLFLPPGATPARHPALLFVHGGPQRQMLPAFNAMGYYSNAYLMNQTLASQGYVVLSVNYRSGSGYGEAFRNAPGTGRAGASEYRDVQAAAAWLKARSDVEPAQIGIWGGSWGGYLTALALARNSDTFAAGADFHGVHDMTEPDHPGLSPAQNRSAHDMEWRSSPVADIEHWHAPVMLVHGDDDRNVEFEQSVLLARMLTTRGIPYEDHVFSGERHAFLRMQDWLTAYLWMDSFFDRILVHRN